MSFGMRKKTQFPLRAEQEVQKSAFHENSGLLEKDSENKLKVKQNSGHWTTAENVSYLVFIIHYKSTFEDNSRRKIWRIFKEMSKFIDSRNYIQCRSHHQKMIEQYESIDKYVSLKNSAYSQRSISKARNQLLNLKNARSEIPRPTIPTQVRQSTPQLNPISQSVPMENQNLTYSYMPPETTYMNYQPYMIPYMPMQYPFYWG